MQPIQGIHHITAFASDPQANLDFYHHVLGQRLVKTSVNYEDTSTYHFFYGDEIGNPGTLLTFFPWVGSRKGYTGNGEVGATAYAISPNSIDYWKNRLEKHGVSVDSKETRFGCPVLKFSDPDSTALELVATDEPAVVQYWSKGPVPEEHALRGFYAATVWAANAEPTARLMTDIFGYKYEGEEGNRQRYRSQGTERGRYIDFLVDPSLKAGVMGAGSIHHIAFRAKDNNDQIEYQRKLAGADVSPTPVRDREYFKSIYFHVPSGVLFEIATDPPGFTIDESVEELGNTLKLPSWLDHDREAIEDLLPPIVRKDVVREE